MQIKGTILATLLNSGIGKMTDDNTTRGDVILQMATAASISASTVQQILGETINCPPISRLQGFSRVLNISLARIRSAAEDDGCSYDDKGIALCVILREKVNFEKLSNDINKQFTKE